MKIRGDNYPDTGGFRRRVLLEGNPAVRVELKALTPYDEDIVDYIVDLLNDGWEKPIYPPLPASIEEKPNGRFVNKGGVQ